MEIPQPDATEFVITHDEPVLALRRTHVVGEKRDTFSLDLTTDGRPISVERSDLKLRGCAYWDRDVLVFDTTVVRAGEEATNVVRYTLSGDRGELVAEEHFRSRSLNYDNMWLFERADR